MFKHLGGTIDDASCHQVSHVEWCKVVESEYAEIEKCDCVAPAADKFNLHHLEIGAADGVYLSNTLFFEAQMGYDNVIYISHHY